MHDLRHASASWALAGGATVQQVREHLGHVSLRAVERYLHNLPGAAGALARVRATGALYPVITPSYTPVPLISAPTAAAVPVPAPEQDADALRYTPQSPEQSSLDACAAVSRREDGADTRALYEPSLVSAGVVFAETVTAPSKPSDAADLPVACRFTEPEAVHVEGLATGRERYLEHLRLKSQATMLASGDKSTFAAESLRPATAGPSSSRQANQTSSAPEKCSAGSDPLTTDEQRIKKPVPSTPGDRL